jgi:acyl-phosphate glycerol 3-phosphate acyltransferase
MWIEAGLIIGAYLYGSVPFVWTLARFKGDNLRERTSGSISATNLAQAVGLPKGIIGGVGDFTKGLLPILIGYYVLDLELRILCLAGVAGLIGQIWPIFLKFFGGRGGTAGGGITFAFMVTRIVPWTTMVIAIPIAIGGIWRALRSKGGPTRSVPLGMFLTFALLPFLSWLWWDSPRAVILTFVTIVMLLIIRRLSADLGRDLRAKPATESLARILLYRFLYDRSYIDRYY